MINILGLSKIAVITPSRKGPRFFTDLLSLSFQDGLLPEFDILKKSPEESFFFDPFKKKDIGVATSTL